MSRFFTLVISLLLSVGAAFAQTGDLQGTVFDEMGEPISFSVLVLSKDGSMSRQAAADTEGRFNFANIEVGTYDLTVSYVGYPQKTVQAIKISAGKITNYDFHYKAEDLTNVEVVEVTTYREPIVCLDCGGGGIKITDKDIKHLATRDPSTMIAMDASSIQTDEGEKIHTSGGRSTSNLVMIDGVLSYNGLNGIQENEIAEIQVNSSGISSEFGDMTGSVTNITTKGPSSYFSGAVQMETSQCLDPFAANTFDLGLSGPILFKPQLNIGKTEVMKDDRGRDKREVVLGYRLSGRYTSNLDARPSALGSYRLSDEKLADILAHPLLTGPDGQGRISNAETITADDLVSVKVRPNGRNSSAIFNARLEYKPTQDVFFSAGLQGQFDWGQSPSVANRLFNSEFNPIYHNSNWRVYGRLRHTVSSTVWRDTSKTSIPPVFQNLSYEIQGDYSQSNNESFDPRFRDRAWEYGYAGQIRRSQRPVIGIVDTNYILNSSGDTLATEAVFGHAYNQTVFNGYTSAEAMGFNGGLSSYNQVVDFNQITDIEQMEVINGRFTTTANSVFGLFNNAYNTGTGISKSNSTQIRGTVKANFDLLVNKGRMRHSITVGGVYEQRVFRSYNLDPFSLWTLADQSANSHISNAADRNNPVLDANGNAVLFFDPLTQRYYAQNNSLIRVDESGNPVPMSAFGEHVREFLDKKTTDWVNVHEINPNDMQMSWFEPTTLISGTQQVANYYGYDYLGNALGTNVSFNDFFNATDANGRKTRPVAPFSPIYVAGYIQDKFKFKDMIFRVGLRFDSYDANTKVLKDPYSVSGYYTSAEFEKASSGYAAAQVSDYVRPGNIGDDYAVYVNQNSPDASIIGYRKGDQWYDANGLAVNTPTQLGSIVLPALRGFSTAVNDPQGGNYDPDQAFRDYTPTLVVMPRVAFSFPVGERASFYANYDILSMRPPEATLATPLTYFNFRNNAGLMSNPNLRPQRTINYEVGYQQALTENMGIKFSLLYREERDLIQARQYILAYPISYTSYGNDDFSTVKSFKFEYELRPDGIKNKNLRIVANYNLQFAEGTGSSPTSSLAVAATDMKYIFPLDFDQRHTFFLLLDYRYGAGKAYNGPRIGKVNVLENMGLNLNFNLSSGTPYTSKQIPGGIGTSFGNAVTEGSINGARVPWNFRIDLRLDRDIVIGKKTKTPIQCNIYLRVQNVLNTRNVLNVYSVTGSALDDGFLTMQDSPGLGLLASRASSYQLLYDLRMRDPFNISRPRRIFVGAVFSF